MSSLHSVADNSCKSVTCPRNEICIVNIQSIPMCRCPTPFWCKHGVRRPLCSEEGVTYKSRCYLKIDECTAGKKIKIKHRGSCRPQRSKPLLSKSDRVKERAERRKERRKEKQVNKERKQQNLNHRQTDRLSDRQRQEQRQNGKKRGGARRERQRQVGKSGARKQKDSKSWDRKDKDRKRFKRRYQRTNAY